MEIYDRGTIVLDLQTGNKYLVYGGTHEFLEQDIEDERYALLRLNANLVPEGIDHNTFVHPENFRIMGKVDLTGKNLDELVGNFKLLDELPELAEHIKDPGLFRLH